MKLDAMKRKVREFRDLYGSDIIFDFESATTEQELLEVLDQHIVHIEECANDAARHVERFKQSLNPLTERIEL